MHRHANAVFFAGLLQKAGLKQEDVAKVLRRIGIDDINMTSIFSMLEEEKIKNAYGRVVEMSLE
jgi:ribulose 1,5-bisphosphate carboxylase large subunit-like protein